ncbi:MAG: class I SAM-dependent methyltransferase [Nitrosopumilus sp.]|nr:class I SAM-dependent methyltransferase [Nitrosopumilaceae archaeon]MBA4438697.1 class I SAM-dependent methyltransferase [Nitrosopumilaceae archaeon]
MNMRKSIREQYLQLLDREPTLDDLDFYADEIQNNKINLEQLSLILKNSSEYTELQKKEISQNESIKIDTYNDVRIQGQTISLGYRESVERYQEIFEFCKKFNRPISVLDLGAAEGYFTFRLSEDFSGVFVAVEGDSKRNLLDSCKKNNNQNILLLEKQMNLKHLQNLKEVQHFDIVLALNVVHHFDEPFQDVLELLVSMSSFCFFEHPNSLENTATKNSSRLKSEKLELEKFLPRLLNKSKSGLGDAVNKKLERNMWLLKNTQSKTIDRAWRGTEKYDEEFGPDSHIDIKSNFDEILIDYGSRNEKRNWIQGIDLRTFLENNGVYPTNDQVFDMINSMNADNARDLGPHNLILNGHELFPIDQDDKFDDVNTKEKLKSFLIQSGLL